MTTLTAKRIESIDVLRGIVMVIMTLDHARDFFHISANVDSPLNLATTTPVLYFTRWITHFCAPIFVLLSGTSIYLQSLRKSRKELVDFLMKRGIWLIIAECVIVTFAMTFNPFFNVIQLQVIWTIGISMVILSLLIRFRASFKLLLTLGLIIILGHNLLDFVEAAPNFKTNFWWDLIHHGRFTFYQITDNYSILIAYPFLPWTGLMLVGYCLGKLFTIEYTSEQRKKIMIGLGSGLLILFVTLRFINVYGDPVQWTAQRNNFYTFLSFININKYPPSLFFISVTIGVALIALAYLENIKNTFTDKMIIFGKTAFFYYILHFTIIHFLSAIAFLARGHSFTDAGNVGKFFPFWFLASGEGYNLWVVYGVWIFVVVSLFPVCKWYDQYKTNHKEKWWLSYL